jgi:hypothetical protein
MIPGFHLTALPANMPKQKMKPTEEPRISITAGPLSSSNFPRRVFDVPDSFQATVKLTLRFSEPSISSTRLAGIAMFTPSTGHYFGATKRIDAAGHLVGVVSGQDSGDGSSGSSGGDQHVFFADPQPFFEETVHLRITVTDRRFRFAEFSRDGEGFTRLKGRLGGQSVEPQRKLILFAYSGDNTSFTASFSDPKIVDLAGPQA